MAPCTSSSEEPVDREPMEESESELRAGEPCCELLALSSASATCLEIRDWRLKRPFSESYLGPMPSGKPLRLAGGRVGRQAGRRQAEQGLTWS
jgi:hypothetical protein